MIFGANIGYTPPEGKEVGKTVWIILKGLRHPNNFGIFNMNDDMQVPLDKEACMQASKQASKDYWLEMAGHLCQILFLFLLGCHVYTEA